MYNYIDFLCYKFVFHSFLYKIPQDVIYKIMVLSREENDVQCTIGTSDFDA